MIIQSLLDTDLYKFTMQQCVLHQFPAAEVAYRFKCRTPGIDLRPFLAELQAEIDSLCNLYFRDEELAYLAGLRFMKSDFIEFLSLFHLKRKYVTVEASDDFPCGIDIRVEGPWLHTILFEIPILAIVNEVYFRNRYPDLSDEEGLKRLNDKIDLILNEPDNGDLRISDYGTRRRFSRDWQDRVVGVLKDRLGAHLAGTSNVALAQKYGLIPLGTMAHEYLQACQALGPAFATVRSTALKCGPRSTAETSALRFPTSTGRSPSSGTSTCSSANSLTARATIRGIPSSGASA